MCMCMRAWLHACPCTCAHPPNPRADPQIDSTPTTNIQNDQDAFNLSAAMCGGYTKWSFQLGRVGPATYEGVPDFFKHARILRANKDVHMG